MMPMNIYIIVTNNSVTHNIFAPVYGELITIKCAIVVNDYSCCSYAAVYSITHWINTAHLKKVNFNTK